MVGENGLFFPKSSRLRNHALAGGKKGEFPLTKLSLLVAGGGEHESQGKQSPVNKKIKNCSRGMRGAWISASKKAQEI